MGCNGGREAEESKTQEIKVESVTFYRSDENGNPSQQVDGQFFTTGMYIL
jgi:hypothetical protein